MRPVGKFKSAIILIIFPLYTFLSSAVSVSARIVQPEDITVKTGYQIELYAEDLAAPTMAVSDDQGRMLVSESGYGGAGEPKITRIDHDGSRTKLTKEGVFGSELPVTAVAFYQGKVFVVHAGTVSLVNDDGSLQTVITGLPGQGDYEANQLVFKDGKLYLSIGTVTNSAVVGEDNVFFGWLKKSEYSDLHDVPCEDVTLSDNSSFDSAGVTGNDLPKARTSAFSPFGTPYAPGSVIEGSIKCSGAILSANPDGTDLRVYAWGFRNPYGLQVGPDGALYVSMHGFDARGARPIENAPDCFYKVTEGYWYGWPDFACDEPVTDPKFKPKGQPQPQFLMAAHPQGNPPKPIVKFPPHAAANGFAFAPSGGFWGNNSDVYLALFGDLTPATGTVEKPQGVKIIKINTADGRIEEFIRNKIPGQASSNNAGGLEHPSAVVFGPDGNMYITDWGVARISVDGLKLIPDSGVIWKVSQSSQPAVSIPATSLDSPSLLFNFLITLVLAATTLIILRNGNRRIGWINGMAGGLVSGIAMTGAALLISKLILNLPWYAPVRVMAILVMGSSAIANILRFDSESFILGLAVWLVSTSFLGIVFSLLIRSRNTASVLVGGFFYGLTVWALLQFFIFPAINPLITQKGFPPFWYMVGFAIYGLVLGGTTVRSWEDKDQLPDKSHNKAKTRNLK